ncbi:hypothetical protein ACFXPA_49135 [Amycolatopsis sp. NPDC059090]|uniref:hypothetical protein n=1 Tax=Amycolatopsis sp. NPDC059090 TaxID=3346723 RepID=UPI003672F70D
MAATSSTASSGADRLTAMTAGLPDASPADTEDALGRLAGGLVAASACGLAAAADARWRSRRANAAVLESSIACYLDRAGDRAVRIVLPGRSDGEDLSPAAADAAVEAIAEFCRAASPFARTAGEACPDWPVRRDLLHLAKLWRELGEAWAGRRPSYRRR